MNPLNFTIEQQICSEWCWAAVASAVCKCYNDPDAPSQRDVVDIVLGAPSGSHCNCEQDPSSPCNAPMSLPSVLDQVGHARDDTGRSMTFEQVVAEIDRQRPIVVQVALDDLAASSHAISIYGYGNDRTVLIADPMHPDDKITVSFDDFVASRPTAFHGTWQAGFRTLPKQPR